MDFKAGHCGTADTIDVMLAGKQALHSLVSFMLFIVTSLCMVVSFSVSIKYENSKIGSIQISLQEG